MRPDWGLKNSLGGTPNCEGSARNAPVRTAEESSGVHWRVAISNSGRSKLAGLTMDRSDSVEMPSCVKTSFSTARDAVPVRANIGGDAS